MALDIDSASAASLISAILEHSGYVTQSEILNDFKDFFRDAGALIYFIALVGGLISLAIFGSFRASRYLIIGPAIYWLLVGPQTEIPGVKHRFGKSEAMNEELQQNVGEVTDYKTKGNVSVAYGFKLFTAPIDETVNLLVENITSGLEQEDMLFLSKIEGLELVARSRIESSELVEMLEEEIVKPCYPAFKMAFDASQNYIKPRITVGLSGSGGVDRPRHMERFRTKTEAFKKNAEDIFFDISEDGELNKLIKRSSKWYSRRNSVASTLMVDGEPVKKISCATGWNVLFDELWHHASKAVPNKLIKSSGSNSRPDSLELQCKEITRKLYDDQYEGEMCSIIPGVAMAMLWNHLSHDDFVGRIQRRHRTGSEPLNARQHKVDISMVRTMGSSLGGSLGAAFSFMDVAYNELGRPILKHGLEASGYKMEGTWAQYTLAHGATHVEEVGLPIYVMVRARQFLYSFALNLPYYQGLLLYILAIAYPFFALVVLIPGKAANFLFLPLAWLWVKSWDVGFAAVFVLERVMYNLLPNWSLSPNLREGPWTYDKLPEILGEGYNFSHIQSVSQHYTFLSMALSGVPAIMGLMTIKGKKAILASFTDAVQTAADSSAQTAAGEYSITASNERAQVLAHLRGLAISSVQNQGVESGLRGRVGMGFAAISALGKSPAVLTSLDPTNSVAERMKKIVGAGNDAGEAALDTYQKIVRAEAKHEANLIGIWDPLIGRWGKLQMFSNSYAAALDGAGAKFSAGYELTDHTANTVDTMAKLLDEKHGVILEAMGNISYAEGRALGQIGTRAADSFLHSFDPQAKGGLFESNKKPETGFINGFLAVQAMNTILKNRDDGLEKVLGESENGTAEKFRKVQGFFTTFLDTLNEDSGYSRDEFIQRFTSQPAYVEQESGTSGLFKFLSQGRGNGLTDGMTSLFVLSHGTAGGYEGNLGHPLMASMGGNRTPGEFRDGVFQPAKLSLVGSFFQHGVSSGESVIKNVPGVAYFFDMLGGTTESVWTRMALVKEEEERTSQPELYQRAMEESKKRVLIELQERLGVELNGGSSEKEIVDKARRLYEKEKEKYPGLSSLPASLESLADGSAYTYGRSDAVTGMSELRGAPKFVLDSVGTWLDITAEQKYAFEKIKEKSSELDPKNFILDVRDMVPRGRLDK